MISRIVRPATAAIDRVVDRMRNGRPIATVAINRRPIRATWGGGNQWLTQMTRWLRANGCSVRFSLDRTVDCILLADPRTGPTVTFDIDAIEAYRSRHPQVACIHRVNDNDKHRSSDFRDALQAEGSRVADHTVFVSAWLRDYEQERWFDAARPHSVIVNGADPAVFHPIGRARLKPGEAMRLVTHHWSNNWNKGFAVYAEIDRLIAHGRLPDTELWVIGRWPQEIRWWSARTFPPDRGAAIAALLRQCHVYVTASLWESGPMHVIEGIQCGLPVLYHENGGGVVEIARRFGIGFSHDIQSAIAAMRARHEELRREVLIEPPSGDRMCGDYQRLILQVMDMKRYARTVAHQDPEPA